MILLDRAEYWKLMHDLINERVDTSTPAENKWEAVGAAIETVYNLLFAAGLQADPDLKNDKRWQLKLQRLPEVVDNNLPADECVHVLVKLKKHFGMSGNYTGVSLVDVSSTGEFILPGDNDPQVEYRSLVIYGGQMTDEVKQKLKKYPGHLELLEKALKNPDNLLLKDKQELDRFLKVFTARKSDSENAEILRKWLKNIVDPKPEAPSNGPVLRNDDNEPFFKKASPQKVSMINQEYEKAINSPSPTEGVPSPFYQDDTQLASAGTGTSGTGEGSSGTGAVSAASVKAAAYRTASAGVKKAGAKASAGKLTGSAAVYNDMLNKIRDLYKTGFSSLGMDGTGRPPVPGPQGPGAQEATITFSDNKLRKLNGKDIRMAGCFEAAFAILLAGSPESAELFQSVVEDGYDSRLIYSTMLVYGNFKRKPQPVQMGDLVELIDPVSGQKYWGVAITANATVVTEAAVIKENSFTVKVKKGMLGEPLRVWAPHPWKLFSETSQFGRFWGPYMSRLRSTISLSFSTVYNIFDMGKVVFANTPFSQPGPMDFKKLMADISREFYIIGPQSPAFPGCLLFNDNDDQMGVLLSDGSITGVKERCVEFMPWQWFAPKYVWYPHL